MFSFGNIGKLRLGNTQMLVDKIGTFVFRYGYKCVTKESQFTFRFMRGGVSSSNLGRPLFVLEVLTYMSKAIDPGFRQDTPYTDSSILLFFLRSGSCYRFGS